MNERHPELAPEAWALLGFIHRHTHGGPRPPDVTSPAFADCYERLVSLRFIERSGGRATWVITGAGDDALRVRYASD